MKTLILIRHGETQKNKNHSNRTLTKKGTKELLHIAQDLKKFCPEKKYAVIVSSAVRARRTAEVLSNVFDFKYIIEKEMRVQNLDNIKSLIESNELKGIRPAKTFLNLSKSDLVRLSVEDSNSLVKRWLNIIYQIKDKNIIIISHECSLEAFYYNQFEFDLVKKSFNKYFGYGSYAILKSKKKE